MADGGAEGAGRHSQLVHPNLHLPHMPEVPIPHMPEVHMPQRPRLSKSSKSGRFGSFMIRGSNFGRQSTVGISTMLKNIGSFRKATGDRRRRSSAVAPLEWEPEDEAELLAPGEPKQLLRAASPAMMKWLLRYLVSLGANEYTLTTHDAVHGEGANWDKKLHKKHGFGYPPPTCKACIREITRAAQTNLYYFLTQREEGSSLRQELQKEFGDGWRNKCFGRATHFLSHSWDMPFRGFIDAVSGVPEGSFVWNDIIAINQHGDSRSKTARERMKKDMASIEYVIKCTRRIVLYWHPIDKPAPVERVWCLFEILQLLDANGQLNGQLQLGVTKEGNEKLEAIGKYFYAEQTGKRLFDIRKEHDKIKGADPKPPDKDKTMHDTLMRSIERIDSEKAKSTVPDDGVRIKKDIIKAMKTKSYKEFDNQIRRVLTDTVNGYTSHHELEEVGTMLHECPPTKDKDRKRHEVMNELLKSLSRAGLSNRRLPPNDLKFGLDALHLDGEELKGKGFDDLKRAGGKLKNVHGLGVAQLLRCAKGLTCVDLSHNDLGPEVAIAIGEALERNDSLTQLYLNDGDPGRAPHPIGLEGAMAMGRALKLNNALVKLSFDGSFDLPIPQLQGREGVGSTEDASVEDINLKSKKLSDCSGIAISYCIRRNLTLKRLSVQDNYIYGMAARHLAEAAIDLCRNASLEFFSGVPVGELRQDGLTELILPGCKLGPAEGRVIANLIGDSTKLLTLDLQKNHLDADAGYALGEALADNKMITDVSLGDNHLGPEGTSAIAEALKRNGRLRILDLRMNQIGVKGSEAIAEALSLNRVLQELKLGSPEEGNDIGHEGGKAIAKALHVNTSLTELDMRYCQLDGSAELMLKEAVAKRAGNTLKLTVDTYTSPPRLHHGATSRRHGSSFGLGELVGPVTSPRKS